MNFIIAFIGFVASEEGLNCIDSDLVDGGGDGCDWYYQKKSECGWWDTEDFSANDACCACKNPNTWDNQCEDGSVILSAGEDYAYSYDFKNELGEGCDWYYSNWAFCGSSPPDTLSLNSARDCCACGKNSN